MQRIGLQVTVLLCALAFSVAAQKTKAPAKAKAGSIQGTMRMVNKDKSEMTVHTSQGADRTVVYNCSTSWAEGSSKKQTPSTMDKLKEGYFVNCGGTYDGVKLVAKNCYFREHK